jgi:beta-alanine degradation protein BauB
MRNRQAALAVFALSALASRSEAEDRSHTLIPQFENASVRVWKTVLTPHERLGMHRHDGGRVVVALRGGTLTIPQADGGSHQLVMETGKAYWLDADPPGKLHGDENRTSKPIEMMIIEMQNH